MRRRQRTRTVTVAGLLLNVEGRYVCWDSYGARWYLGPRRLSEVFAWRPFGDESKRTREALTRYPSATVVYERG